MKSTRHSLLTGSIGQLLCLHTASRRLAKWSGWPLGDSRGPGAAKMLSRGRRWKDQFSIILWVRRDEHCELVPSLCVSCQLSPPSHHPRTCPWKSSTCVLGAGERSEDSLLAMAKKCTSIFSQPLFRDFCLFVCCFTHKTESFNISQYSALLVYFFIISHSVAMMMSFITKKSTVHSTVYESCTWSAVSQRPSRPGSCGHRAPTGTAPTTQGRRAPACCWRPPCCWSKTKCLFTARPCSFSASGWGLVILGQISA